MKFAWFILLCSFGSFGREINLTKKEHRNGLDYIQYIKVSVDEQSDFTKKYRNVQKHINLQVDYPGSKIIHIARDAKEQIEFSKTYTTTQFGFRNVPLNSKSTSYLILAGDSNVFGIGCNDNETLSSYLSALLPQSQVVNMGMAGTAGNALLFFLEHFSLKEVLSDANQKGTMLFDFNDYLIERMIGGKNFVRWGWMQPAYQLQDDKIQYAGTFNEQWITKFYKVIGFIDPKNFLIPNLPRINQDHLKLIARIFLEIKKTFLAQTRPDNRFAILIDPFTLNESNREIIARMKKEFAALGLETIEFNREESLKHISIYPNDLHMRPDGQKYYAGLIAEAVGQGLK